MIIIKIGGGESINIEAIAEDVAIIEDSVIIVHGANYYRDQLLEKIGVQKEILTSVKGYSSVNSTPDILDAMMMTYSGLRNKRIVEIFHQKRINAIGLSGIDGGLIRGTRNKGIRVIENGKKKMKRDLSGKAKSINGPLLKTLLSKGYTPIITMPILDENNIAINSENDDLVGLLAKELNPSIIYLLIEEEGYIDKTTGNKIDQINLSELEELIQQSESRIQRKLHAIKNMILEGKSEIIMTDGRIEGPISNSDHGTIFTIG
ncbi:MAG: amino acid kinase family protein [Candidatus Kariarchaeaceae archaeon]|jgi:acetylglutamate/LysW-gamma-L-alpha-aminoadipate kinase